MIIFLGLAYIGIGLLVLLCYFIDKEDPDDEDPKDWLEDRASDDPLIYYADGETTDFDLAFRPYHANILSEAVMHLCRKLEVREVIVPPIKRARRFALYYSSEPVSQNIMCGEESLESFMGMGVREIQRFEKGPWLVQYCPSGKTFFEDGKDIYGSSLEDVLKKFSKCYYDKNYDEEENGN